MPAARIFCLPLLLMAVFLSATASAAEPAQKLEEAVLLYASFDEKLAADFGGGELELHTRTDDPERAGQFLHRRGAPSSAFRIAEGKGVSGGSLECTDVLPQRGRIYFPAAGNIAYKPGGWGGAVSLWLNTNPDELLKSPFCDPVQITQKRAHDGAIWLDFPDTRPRDLRLGVFPALAAEEKPLNESDPAAPLVRLPAVGFRAGEWRHLAICWENFDTGKANAAARLYLDGKPAGELTGREFAMNWEIEKAGIYIAVNLIGQLDEFAVFGRPLTESEIGLLHRRPAHLNEWNRGRIKEE
mgnify:CR=1 FL=1